MSSNRLPPLRTTSIRANVEGAALERLSGRGDQPRGGDVDVLLNVALQRWSGNRGANGRVYKIGPMSADGTSNDRQTRAFAQAFANMAGVELGANEDPAQNPAFVRALVNHVGRGIAGRNFREVGAEAPVPQADPRRREATPATPDRVETPPADTGTQVRPNRSETAVTVPLPMPDPRPVDASPTAVANDARTIATAVSANPSAATPGNQLAARLNRAKPDEAAYTAAVTSAVSAVDLQRQNRGAALDAVVRAAGTEHARKFLDVIGGDRANPAGTQPWTNDERRDFFRRSGIPDAQGRTPLLDVASSDELAAMSRAMLTETNAAGQEVPRTLAENERVAAATIHARAIAARPDDQVLPNAEHDARFAFGNGPTGLSSLDEARAALPEAERARLQARLSERIGGITPTPQNEAQLRAALALFPTENAPAAIAALRQRLDPATAGLTPSQAEPVVDNSEARTRANALLTPEGDRYQAVRDALAQTTDPVQRRALTSMLMQPGSQRGLTPAELGQLGIDLRLGPADGRSSVHESFRTAADAAIASAPNTPRRELAQAIASVDRPNAVGGNFMTLTRLLRETPDLDANARAAGFGALRTGFERQPGILANSWNRTGIVSSALHDQPVAERVRFVNDFLATVPQTQRAAVDEQIAKSLATRANSAYAWNGDRAGPIAALASGLAAAQPDLAARIHRAAIAEMNERNRGYYMAAMSDDALRTVIAGQATATGPNPLKTTMQNELMRREMTAANDARARIAIGESWNLFNDGTRTLKPQTPEDGERLAAAIGAGDNLAYFQANNFRGVTDAQLANFASFVPDGPVRAALRAEMTRRGVPETAFNPYGGIYPVQTPGISNVPATVPATVPESLPTLSADDQRVSSYITAFAGSEPVTPDQLAYVFSPAGNNVSRDLRQQAINAYFARIARAPANQQAKMVEDAYRAIGNDTEMRTYAGTLLPPALQGFWAIAGLTEGM